MCNNCFSRSHHVKKCESRGSCKVCNQRHHTLLQFPKRNSMPPATPEPNLATKSAENSNAVTPIVPAPVAKLPTSNLVEANSAVVSNKLVVLPTALVLVKLRTGLVIAIRLLLDSCSQVSFVSEVFVKRYRLLAKRKLEGHQSFTGATDDVVRVEHTCSMLLSSRVSDFQLQVNADVVPSNALKYEVNGFPLPEQMQQFKGLPLADPAFANSPLQFPAPDMLLGAEYFEQCMLNETKTCGSLILRKSHFGWVVIGPVYSPVQSFCALTTNFERTALSIFQIEDQLRKFCELEQVTEKEDQAPDEKAQCVRHFEENYKRASDGKFSVRLPLKESPDLLKDNFVSAQRNLIWSESKRPAEIRAEYVAFMREYEELVHMSPVDSSDEKLSKYFIPHHPVVRPDSTTTHTRMVFNASSKTSSGHSLNDLLMVGPTLQPDLMDTLIRFRVHAVAITADIAKMYRCIWVDAEDRPLQCVLWCEEISRPIEAYQLNTLTYGTSCASFIATKCLDVLSETVTHQPAAALAIKQHFYMDDLLTGSNSAESCHHLQKCVHDTLAHAGFVLRKYQSNSAAVLEQIDPSLVEKASTREFCNTDSVSVLGVYWNSKADVFSLKIQRTNLPQSQFTRRALLSEISRTFDPLGFAAPFTIRGKLFVQRVWKEPGGWDDPLPRSWRTIFGCIGKKWPN